MKKIKSIIFVAIFTLVVFSASALCYFSPSEEYTNSERRELAQFPELTKETVLSGEFRSSFETYSADQFPFREDLRKIKAMFTTYALNKKDNNGLYFVDGHLSKIEDKENEYMLDYSANLFRQIYEKNIKDKNAKVYFSIVPDKNMFLADKNGYPSLDYEGIELKMKNKTSDFMNYISVKENLELSDYYRTDSHWKQEKITDIAEGLANAMGTDISAKYTVKTLDYPFYGVYAGQSALPVAPDKIKYLTNSTIENAVVSYYDTGKPKRGDMYDMEKAYSKDPYEMFLSGAKPLIVIENPDAKTDKKLVIFRDSFGSSLAPLMIEGYKKITVVDIRYMQSSFVGNFVDFTDCDVLFIYSTALINNSTAMK